MKQKNIHYIIAGLATLTIFSCTKENHDGYDHGTIGVFVSTEKPEEATTKATDDDGGIPYIFEIGSDTLSLTESVSTMEAPKPAAETKGVPITEAGTNFNIFFLYVQETLENGTMQLYLDRNWMPGTSFASYENGEWSLIYKSDTDSTDTYKPYTLYWPEDEYEKLTFFASNTKDNPKIKSTTVHNNTDGHVSLTYVDDGGTQGKSAEEETDLVYAFAKYSRSMGRKRTNDTAIGLQFHHALAGLKFNFGTITSGLTLTNVTLTGIKTSYSVEFYGTSMQLTSDGTSSTLSQDFSTATNSGTECDATGERTFFIPPQDITDDAAITITLESTTLGKTITKTFNFKAFSSQTEWEAGSLYAYTLSANVMFAELGQTMLKICSSLGLESPQTDVKTINFSVNDKSASGSKTFQSSRSLTPIYATFNSESGELKISTAATKIFFPEDSGQMFYGLNSLTSIENLSAIDSRNVTSMKSMFQNCYNLKSVDLSKFDTSNVTNMYGMFWCCSNLTALDVSNFNTSKVTDMSYMFELCTNLSSLDVSNFDTSNVTVFSQMFYDCRNLTSLDVSGFDTSKATIMLGMFANCKKLTSLDLSNFKTDNVTNMSIMFNGSIGLTSLDLSNFNTSKVTDMNYMFASCRGLSSLNISNFDTSKVTDMSYMFYNCQKLTSLDLSKFNTSNVTNMTNMFRDMTRITSLNINFDTSKVTNMSYMFSNCKELTSLNVSKFNTAKVTNMSHMFYDLNRLTSLSVSNFNTAKVTDMSDMFNGVGFTYFLDKLDLSNFNTSNVTNMNNMFDCLTTYSLILGKNFTVASKKTNMLSNFCWMLGTGGTITCTKAAQTALLADGVISDNANIKGWTIIN